MKKIIVGVCIASLFSITFYGCQKEEIKTPEINSSISAKKDQQTQLNTQKTETPITNQNAEPSAINVQKNSTENSIPLTDNPSSLLLNLSLKDRVTALKLKLLGNTMIQTYANIYAAKPDFDGDGFIYELGLITELSQLDQLLNKYEVPAVLQQTYKTTFNQIVASTVDINNNVLSLFKSSLSIIDGTLPPQISDKCRNACTENYSTSVILCISGGIFGGGPIFSGICMTIETYRYYRCLQNC